MDDYQAQKDDERRWVITAIGLGRVHHLEVSGPDIDNDERVEVVPASQLRGAVDDREHLIALLHRIDHRLAADPQACGMCAKVRAALPSGGNDAA